MNRPLISLAACASTVLFAAGCGSDEDTTDTTASSSTAAAVTSSVVVTASSIAVPTTLSTATTLDPTVTTVDPAVATTVIVSTTIASRVVTSPSDNVRKGDTGPGVEQIQAALKAAGYTLSVDGIFGNVTDTAVRDYQGKNGLAVDGIVGPNTWAKLGSAADSTTTTTTTA